MRIADRVFELLNDYRVRKLTRRVNGLEFLAYKHRKNLRDLNAAYMRALVRNRRLREEALRELTGRLRAEALLERAAQPDSALKEILARRELAPQQVRR